MADQPKASSIPSYGTYEDYDVLGGKSKESQQEYMQATFYTSDMTDGDARFKAKAELLGSSGSEILGQEEVLETKKEDEMETNTAKQVKEAAL